MLSLGKFPLKSVCNTISSQNFHFPIKTHFSFSPNFYSFGKKPTGFCLHALKTKKRGDFSGLKVDGPDEFANDFEDEFIDIETDGDFEEDDEADIPLKEMKKWLENKPRGFGEGKVYDTSIEDKLMEELEQSRKAQLANINKLKNNPQQFTSKKEQNQQEKVSTHVQDGARVRVVNLPKKKNVHRDLQLAFKGVPGVLNIIPTVTGNKKTRDPICKGIAFIYFQSEDEAQRFVQNFSGQSISFGKIQKQIKCNVMNSNSANLAGEQSEDETDSTPGQAAIGLDEASDSDIDVEDNLLASSEKSFPREYDDADERHVSAQWEDNREKFDTSSISVSETSPSSSKKGRKLKVKDKKVASKRSKDQIPKINTLGSANRLKIREKAVLTDVFSKYGTNSNMAVKEQS